MRHFQLALLVASLTSASGHAESLHAVRPLPGYVCMQLTLTPAQLTDPKVGVPVRDAPNHTARIVGYASNTLIAQDQTELTSGFRKVLQLNGEAGWIDARYLRAWSNPLAPTSKCSPAMMSDGKPGFGSVH